MLDFAQLRAEAEAEAERIRIDAEAEAEIVRRQQALLAGLKRRKAKVAYEASFTGVVAMITCAHLSSVSMNFPSEVRLNDGITICRDDDGKWAAIFERDDVKPGYHSPRAIAISIASAAGLPENTAAVDMIIDAAHALKHGGFEQLGILVDELPLHSVAAAMACGPLLYRALANIEPERDFDANKRFPDQDGDAPFASIIADAVIRRGADLEHYGSDVTTQLDADFKSYLLGNNRKVPDGLALDFSRDAAIVRLVKGQFSSKTKLTYIKEAVRAGGDLNVADGEQSLARTCVRGLDLKTLKELSKLGMDFSAANGSKGLLIDCAMDRVHYYPARLDILTWLIEDLGLGAGSSNPALELAISIKDYENAELDKEGRQTLAALKKALNVLGKAKPRIKVTKRKPAS